MININEEMKLIMADYQNESLTENELFSDIEKKLQKQNKLQQRTCLVVEDLTEQFEKVVEEQTKVKSLEQENKMLLNALMASYDLFSEVLLGASEQHSESWYQQMILQSERLAKMMQEIGITVINPQNSKLDLIYHKVVGYQYDDTIQEKQILKYIKVGYIYKGNVIRKAEVIINKVEE